MVPFSSTHMSTYHWSSTGFTGVFTWWLTPVTGSV
jgi:hypothetical protein